MNLQALRNEIELLDMSVALNSCIDDVMDRARINADDTIYVEKVTDQSYDAIMIASICDILSYSNDEDVCNWFASRGVKW